MSVGEFDRKKALGEMITALAEIEAETLNMQRDAENTIAVAERRHATAAKLNAYVRGELSTLRAHMQKITAEEQTQ